MISILKIPKVFFKNGTLKIEIVNFETLNFMQHFHTFIGNFLLSICTRKLNHLINGSLMR